MKTIKPTVANYIGTVKTTERISNPELFLPSQGVLIYVKKETKDEYIGNINFVDLNIPIKIPKNKCTSLELI